jgi:hypothetical protein
MSKQPDTTFLKAKEILATCTFPKLDSKTTESPFFTPVTDNAETMADIINRPQKDNTDIIDLAASVNLPATLYNMYLMMDSNKREFSYNIFHFFSINEIIERRGNNIKDKQTDITDLACSYYGMGHIIVLSWNSKRNVFILRRDGGSNDYDRRDNRIFIVNYDAQSTPSEKRISSEIIFQTLAETNLEGLRDLFINN